MTDLDRAAAAINQEGHLIVTARDGERYTFWAGSCGETGCDCRDIVLYPVDGKNPEGSGLDDVDELRIDPNAAVIMDEDGSPLEMGDVKFLAALDDSLTGDVLDRLVVRWHEDKGLPVLGGRRTELLGLEDWTLDDPVAWEQVFEPLRIDDYVVDGIIYSAMELYNANPADPESEIFVDFAESDDDDDDDDDGKGGDDEDDDEIPIGMVSVRLDGGVTMDPEEGEAEILETLWKLYQKRHPGKERMRRRQAEMKRFGAELLRTRRKK